MLILLGLRQLRGAGEDESIADGRSKREVLFFGGGRGHFPFAALFALGLRHSCLARILAHAAGRILDLGSDFFGCGVPAKVDLHRFRILLPAVTLELIHILAHHERGAGIPCLFRAHATEDGAGEKVGRVVREIVARRLALIGLRVVEQAHEFLEVEF